MPTAFVTGATGFLGRHLVDALLREEWEITALRLPDDRIDVLPGGVRTIVGDLADLRSLDAAVPDDVDAVFHLAGNTSTWSKDADAQVATNVRGTEHVIAAAVARSARRLVYTSSISAYGYQPGVTIDETTPTNVEQRGDAYGRSKRRAERLVEAASASGALPGIILNPVNIIGRYDRANWSKQLIVPIAQGGLRVVPPGSASWTAAGDVADAHIRAAEHPGPAQRYVLGGVRATFLEVVNEIERLLDEPVSPRASSGTLLRAALVVSTATAILRRSEPELSLAKYRRAVGDLRVDDRRARDDLGYRHADLHTMLADTVDWLVVEGVLSAPARVRGHRG